MNALGLAMKKKNIVTLKSFHSRANRYPVTCVLSHGGLAVAFLEFSLIRFNLSFHLIDGLAIA